MTRSLSSPALSPGPARGASRSSALASAALLLASILSAASVGAVQAPDGLLKDHDARWSRGQLLAAAAVRVNGGQSGELLAGPPREPGTLRLAALAALETRLGRRVRVRWDAITGSPRLLQAAEGWLGPPDARAPEAVARDFVLLHRELFRLQPEQVLALEVKQVLPLGGSGFLVHFGQTIADRAVHHGHLSVALGPEGRVLQVMGGGVTGEGAPRSLAPRLDPAEALLALGGFAGLAPSSAPQRLSGLPDGGVFELAGASGPVEVRQVVVPTVYGPRLAWRALVAIPGGLATYEVIVDDASGQPLRRQNHVLYADTRGRVFRASPTASDHEIARFPDATDFRTDDSPAGWIAVDLTEGNNTTVRDDRAGDNEMTLGLQAQGAPAPPYLAFDFPYTGTPTLDLDQSLAQLTWGINWSHDRFREFGFDEPSGAFQVDNFGRPGLGGDPVRGDTQDGSGTNNANFNPSPEGSPARMQMFLWDVGGEQRDSSNDVGVVIHEYAHGVSTRLVGGASDVGCLGGGQGGSMGEGWGDYFAGSWLGDNRIGSYLTADGNGIRLFLLDENPPVAEPEIGKDYGDYCEYRFDDRAAGFCEVHDNGEIWSGFLWLVREALIGVHGTVGSDIADRLAVEGMKLTPCQPTMLDARDGVIAADRLLYDGAHVCLIRAAAADRGLGFSASSTGSGDSSPVAATDLWPDCLGTATLIFTRDGLELGRPVAAYSCSDDVTVSLTDGNAVAPVEVLLTSSSGDRETLTLLSAFDPAVFAGSIRTLLAAPVAEDGILQVAPGDTLLASYTDPDQAVPVEAQADIDCAARIEILSHRFTNSTCDDDTVAGFPQLPGFIDAGEEADLIVTVANRMPQRILGGMMADTDRPDLLSVLPSGSPLPVDIPPASGQTPGLATLTLRVSAVDDFLGATTATLRLSLLANGFDSAVLYELPLELDLDYELLSAQQLAFDPETETGLPAGPDWSTGLLDPAGTNEWTLVTCAAATGGQSYRNGPVDCTGDYTDDQGAPWLTPPAFAIAQPNSVAARLVNLSFSHDVDLGVGGGFPIFDADAVAVYLTADPASVQVIQSLFNVQEAPLLLYANLPRFGIDSNTAGFAGQSENIDPADVNVDLLQPFWLAWFFLNDVTPSEFMGNPIDAQGEGYYLDDLVVTYDLVNVVPSTATCVSTPTVLSIPQIIAPTASRTCAGEPVAIDASRSEAVGCGTPAPLEYRFMIAGVPVACFADGGMVTPRLQGVDGWGVSPTCFDFPVVDTTYEVEVRCALDPSVADLRTIDQRVLHGTAILDAAPNLFCEGGSATLDARDSAVAGCPGGLEYLFSNAGVPLDCDEDGSPDGFTPAATCRLAAAGTDPDYEVAVRCIAIRDCEFTASVMAAALSLVPDAAEVDPAQSPYCPGTGVRVTGIGSMATGCPGFLEYKWTSPDGSDTGWRTVAEAGLSLVEDGDALLEVRCSSAPNCVESAVLSIDVREGLYEVAPPNDPFACPDSPLVLSVLEMPALQCAGNLEYRFAANGTPIDCDGDTVPDGFRAIDTCDTFYVPGGSNYRVDVRCDADPSCVLSSVSLPIAAPNDGTPSGTPFGTLRVAKTGDCPATGDVLLSWADSGRTPPSFGALRATDPRFPDPLTDHLLSPVDGLALADSTADCQPGPAEFVYFYLVVDRNRCDDTLIRDP